MQEFLSVDLPVKPESAGWSREALAECRDRLEVDAYIDLQLIVSELVADAVRADGESDGPIVLRISLDDRRIHVEVRGGAAAYELQSRRPGFGERGWGAYLARTLGAQWGSQLDGASARVWVEMPLAGAA